MHRASCVAWRGVKAGPLQPACARDFLISRAACLAACLPCTHVAVCPSPLLLPAQPQGELLQLGGAARAGGDTGGPWALCCTGQHVPARLCWLRPMLPCCSSSTTRQHDSWQLLLPWDASLPAACAAGAAVQAAAGQQLPDRHRAGCVAMGAQRHRCVPAWPGCCLGGRGAGPCWLMGGPHYLCAQAWRPSGCRTRGWSGRRTGQPRPWSAWWACGAAGGHGEWALQALSFGLAANHLCEHPADANAHAVPSLVPAASLQSGYLYLSDPPRLHDMMCLLGLGDAPLDCGGSGVAGADGGQWSMVDNDRWHLNSDGVPCLLL